MNPAEPYREESAELLAAFDARPTHELLASAAQLRDAGHGRIITYSRKVFIPLTRLCRDVCGYCTFATTPNRTAAAYLAPDEVLAIARAGQAAGCREALFTLGDKPELRYAPARRALQELGFESTWEYLAAMCDLVVRETDLLPHVNAGIMSEGEIEALRRVSVSQGIMLESISSRLCEPGGPHFGSPDKRPEIRLEMIAAAGRRRVPFTSGILIGIGETRTERVQSLLALRDLHAQYSHLQEVIIQNFRAKPGTRMSGSAEPTLEELMWTVAVARHILGSAANIQVPPNLSYGDYPKLLAAGINDWGGISPVTPDHVNPEAPWPHLALLERATEEQGFALAQRLAVYPEYALDSLSWQTAGMAKRVLSEIDSLGLVRTDAWTVGRDSVPPRAARRRGPSTHLDAIIHRSERGDRLEQDEIVRLFSAWGSEGDEICDAADRLRHAACGDVVGYVVNRNINYTNVCSYSCQFCAFSKGRLGGSLRGPAYDLSLDEIARRATEAWARGATEVCMQGGINPSYTGKTYLEIVRAVKGAVPDMHVHAFSPLEVSQGAATLGITVSAFLERLQRAGLGTLPGTAAEILDDEVRAILCPDKLSTCEWIDVVETAHRVGLKTTATIMFGHVERPRSWARHLLELRDIQARTGGLTEIVPLPFVHMEAPIYLKGRARKGPTWRECLLMHAVARLVLHPLITNVQASWVKLSPLGAADILRAGVNDLGGTLMNESISRAAGTQHGQEFAPEQMEELIGSTGRVSRQRTTLYQAASAERRERSFGAGALTEPVFTPLLRQRTAHVH
jgi:FO synthase